MSTFKRINCGKMNKEEQRALGGVYRFFAKDFQPPIHLSDFGVQEEGKGGGE